MKSGYYMGLRLIILIVIISAGWIPAKGQSVYDKLLKSRSLLDASKASEANVYLSNAMIESDDPRLILMRAEALLAMGNIEPALADFISANNKIPGSGEFGLAKIYALKGDAAASLQHLEKNISSEFRKSEKEIMLDEAFGKIENRPEWRLFWKTERYSVPEITLGEIEYYLNTGKMGDALNSLSKLKSGYPDDQNTLFAEVSCLASASEFSEAVSLLARHEKELGSNTRYLHLLASVQISAANFSAASSTISKMIARENVDANLFLKRAECYRKTGETYRASADIAKYLSLFPEDRQGLSLAGRIETDKGDRLKAMEYFSRNLYLNPGNSECYIERANASLSAKSWDAAKKDYSMALDINPGNGDVWLNKGIASLNLGNTEDACHDFRKAHELGNKKAAAYINNNCLK